MAYRVAFPPQGGTVTVTHNLNTITPLIGQVITVSGCGTCWTIGSFTLNSFKVTSTLAAVLMIPVGLSSAPVTFGIGFNVANSSIGPEVMIDTGLLPYRVPPPTGPGAAIDPISGIPYAAGSWAVDSGFLYVCIPDAAGDGAFVWSRAPLVTTW
jgi:hypothetical protein